MRKEEGAEENKPRTSLSPLLVQSVEAVGKGQLLSLCKLVMGLVRWRDRGEIASIGLASFVLSDPTELLVILFQPLLSTFPFAS